MELSFLLPILELFCCSVLPQIIKNNIIRQFTKISTYDHNSQCLIVSIKKKKE